MNQTRCFGGTFALGHFQASIRRLSFGAGISSKLLLAPGFVDAKVVDIDAQIYGDLNNKDGLTKQFGAAVLTDVIVK